MSLTPQWAPNHRISGFGQQGVWQPGPLSYQRRRPARRGPLGSCLVVVLVVAVALFGWLRSGGSEGKQTSVEESPAARRTQQAQPTPTAEGTLTAPPRTPEPEPPASQQWQLPEVVNEELPGPSATTGPWARLQTMPLYAQSWPGMDGCAEPRHVDTVEELEEVVRAELGCLERGWGPVLNRLGLPSDSIPVRVYPDGPISTPCGEKTRSVGFYCSAQGGAIYISTRSLEHSVQSRLWVKGLMFHEYSHHLQNLGGVFHAMAELEDRADATRRMEVQAECMAMGILGHDPTWPVTEDNYAEINRRLTTFVDDGMHGSPRTLSYWGIRAYHSRTVGEGCNTWVVDGDWVE